MPTCRRNEHAVTEPADRARSCANRAHARRLRGSGDPLPSRLLPCSTPACQRLMISPEALQSCSLAGYVCYATGERVGVDVIFGPVSARKTRKRLWLSSDGPLPTRTTFEDWMLLELMRQQPERIVDAATILRGALNANTQLSPRHLDCAEVYRRRPRRLLSSVVPEFASRPGLRQLRRRGEGREPLALSLMLKSFGYGPRHLVLEEPAPETASASWASSPPRSGDPVPVDEGYARKKWRGATRRGSFTRAAKRVRIRRRFLSSRIDASRAAFTLRAPETTDTAETPRRQYRAGASARRHRHTRAVLGRAHRRKPQLSGG